jgi:hypothetical protein
VSCTGRRKNVLAVTLRPDHPKRWAPAVRPRHCPQATSAGPIRTDVLFVDKAVRYSQGYPTSFHKAVGFEEWWAKFRYRARVSGLSRSFAKRPLTACRCVCMLTQTSERHGAERRQTLRREEPIDRVEPGHRRPNLREWSPGGSTGAAVPCSFSDGLRGHRSRSRKGQANRGEGEPERGAPRSTELATAKGYSGLSRVLGTIRTHTPTLEAGGVVSGLGGNNTSPWTARCACGRCPRRIATVLSSLMGRPSGATGVAEGAARSIRSAAGPRLLSISVSVQLV